MALRVSILPKRRAFRAGTDLECTVEAANHSDTLPSSFAIDIAELTVTCTCNERIDRSWVASAYGKSVPPKEKVNRYETREIMSCVPSQLGGSFRLLPGQQRSWEIRLALPSWLPPSFKGSAARFTCHMVASIKFSASPAAMKLLTQHLSLDTSRGRTSRGSLLTIPPRRGPKPRPGMLEVPTEQIATATLPVLIHPYQLSTRTRDTFAEETPRAPKEAAAAIPVGLITGEDAHLQQVEYFHTLAHPPQIHVQEILQVRQSPHSASHPEAASPHQQRNGHVSANHLGDGVTELTVRGPTSPSGNPRMAANSKSPLRSWPAASPEKPVHIRGSNLLSQPARLLPGTPGMQSGTPIAGLDNSLMRTFNLKLAESLLAKVTLHPAENSELCLGSTFSGSIDFRQSQAAAAEDPSLPKCVQFMVVLETEERVESEWSALKPSSPYSKGVLQVQDEYQEMTPDTLLTHFILSVPTSATASFSTHLVSLSWILRFEFVTMSLSSSSGWLGGSSKQVDRIIWSLPILVQPPWTGS